VSNADLFSLAALRICGRIISRSPTGKLICLAILISHLLLTFDSLRQAEEFAQAGRPVEGGNQLPINLVRRGQFCEKGIGRHRWNSQWEKISALKV
jgi:hypothetical protein